MWQIWVLAHEEQEFANDVTKLLSKLRVLASKDDGTATVSKKGEIDKFLFAAPNNSRFMRLALEEHLPIGRLRGCC